MSSILRLDQLAIPEEPLVAQYVRTTENIPYLAPVEIDRENWRIRNSNNYCLYDSDWRRKAEDRSYRLLRNVCGRCGKPTYGADWSSWQLRHIRFMTLCSDCLESDTTRLVSEFNMMWRNKHFRFSRYGKLAMITNTYVRDISPYQEDYQLDYCLRYVESRIVCRYKITEAYEVVDINTQSST